MLIGYARVSTLDQRLDLQQDALREVGCEHVFTELALKRDPQYTIREICEIVGISRNTYYKYTRTENSSPPRERRDPGCKGVK